MSSVDDLTKANKRLGAENLNLQSQVSDYASQCVRLRKTLGWLNTEVQRLEKRLFWTEVGIVILFFVTVTLLYVQRI